MRAPFGLILAFAVLVACDLAGKLFVHELGLPVPGTVIGILILLTGLVVLRRVPANLQRVGEFLLAHLNLFYIPAGVGVMAYVALLADDLWPIVAALFASTFLAMLAAAFAFSWTAKLQGREGEGE
ncbi:LrgA family protein [Parvibaculum lavamentivorans DS-1]|uniref:LrgA family protein n=1 Tax=Parvibaculum lavamentivorans (strain DS-1 / DSM 13023 / NCIMB 13966) TaxID=402881 RepID=A7HQ51_PARL1|nr:LrgA family protein [Parvibaculum lavamentivorans DS-1]